MANNQKQSPRHFIRSCAIVCVISLQTRTRKHQGTWGNGSHSMSKANRKRRRSFILWGAIEDDEDLEREDDTESIWKLCHFWSALGQLGTYVLRSEDISPSPQINSGLKLQISLLCCDRNCCLMLFGPAETENLSLSLPACHLSFFSTLILSSL